MVKEMAHRRTGDETYMNFYSVLEGSKSVFSLVWLTIAVHLKEG